MTTRSQLQAAMDILPSTLSQFDEFVGVGTVPKSNGDGTLVVAVYVSKPFGELSKEFVARIPKEINVKTTKGTRPVQTKVVNVGMLRL